MDRTRKQRSFTKELLIWTILLIVVPLVAISFYFYEHEMSGWRQIEQEKSALTNEAAQKSVARLGDTILGVTITNGYWGDNRQAVLDSDQAWLDKNIKDMPGVVPDVDFVAETDLSGKVLVQSGDVAEFQDYIRLPFILEQFHKQRKFTGLVNTSKGIAVIAVSQVTGDLGKEAPVGLLITGRLLTNEIIQGLKDTLQTDIGLLLGSGQFLSSSEALKADQLKPFLNASSGEDAKPFKLERRNQVFVAEAAAPLLDMSGEAIGVIYTEMPTRSTTEAADGLRTLGFYALGIMLLLFVLVVTLIRHRIILPLRHFTATLEEVAAGKQVHAIPKHVMQAEAQIVSAIHQIREWNQVLERTVEQRTSAIRHLLDNAGQGFMSISTNKSVLGEYSVECTRIFARDIAGIRLSELFYPEDGQERELLDSVLSEFFQEQEDWKKELFFSLLPEEIQINGMIVKVEYKYLPDTDSGKLHFSGPSNEVIMVMLTDITSTRQLEYQMSRERKMLKMVVHTVTHPEDYAQIMHSFEAFHTTELAELAIGAQPVEEKLLSMYKSVHTMKGSFALLQFIHIVPLFHELENQLMELLEQEEKPTSKEFADFVGSLGLAAWLEQDQAMLRQVLGATFTDMGKEYEVKLTKVQWRILEQVLESKLTDPEDRKWLAELKQWRYKPIKAYIKHYPVYLAELADRNGLLLQPVELKGGDNPVDPERLSGWAQSLIHIIRNIVVHGIEPPEERIEQGKDEYATVSFSVESSKDELVVTIADDGRGINLEAVRSKAERQGLWPASASGGTAKAADAMTEDEIAQLIFMEQVSTTHEVTEWSGRGIGLSAVKAETEKLGGTIRVDTTPGVGTSFIIKLPYHEAAAER
ncbi:MULTISPECIES: ATP-binding protein [unclassified Paenibacillus]|uniref:ATP-binding protein n=1 Tax=unclassified Paenibacillus TaxID=185978 RepID=UPI00363B594E